MDEAMYQRGLDYLKYWDSSTGESPKYIQQMYVSRVDKTKAQAVFLMCQFILEAVRREDAEITLEGNVRLLKKETKSETQASE